MVTNAFFTLLKAGLWEKAFPWEPMFPLRREQWIELLQLARVQTVTGVIFRGLQQLPQKWLPPQDLRLKLMIDVSRIERRNQQQNKVIADLMQAFGELNIIPVLQKGQGVAQMYEHPLLRECGDIDLYFDPKDFARARKFMESRALLEVAADQSLFYRFEGECVEHHGQLVDEQNPFHQRHILKLMQEHSYATLTLDSGCRVVVPDGALNLLLINLHILKHALGWGIGLRQMCDLARAYHFYAGKVDKERLNTLYRQLGLTRWNQLLHTFLMDYLGTEEKLFPDKVVRTSADRLYRIVMNGGDFGYLKRDRKHKGSVFLQKYRTLRSFLQKGAFTLKYAPADGFFSLYALIKGQFQ